MQMMQSIGRWGMIAITAMALTAGWAGMAGAEPPAFNNYGQVRGGWNAFDGDLDDADYDNSADFAVAYGRYLTPYLVAEIGLDVFGTTKDIHGSNSTAGSYKREDAVTVMALLGTLKAEYPVGPLRFFGGGGVGGYLLALYSEIDTAQLGDLDENASDTVFGVHVVAGASYDITRRFVAGVQGLYRWTEDVDINESTGTVPVRLEGDLNGYSLMLTAGFRF